MSHTQAECGSGQPGLAVGNPGHGRGVEKVIVILFNPGHSMILCLGAGAELKWFHGTWTQEHGSPSWCHSWQSQPTGALRALTYSHTYTFKGLDRAYCQ